MFYRAQDEIVHLSFKNSNTLGNIRRNTLGKEWRLLVVQVQDDGSHEAVNIWGNEPLRMLRDALNGLDLETEKPE
jgi:hypothetical protein